MSLSGSSSKRKGRRSPWLDAWADPLADMRAFSPCLKTGNISGDGDTEMLVACVDKKLVVYKNTRKVNTVVLLDTPVALCTYHTDSTSLLRPMVAVASGSHIFIYLPVRPNWSLQPYFKFALPAVDVDAKERDVWNDVKDGKLSAVQALEKLTELRDNGTKLTARSKDLLLIVSVNQAEDDGDEDGDEDEDDGPGGKGSGQAKETAKQKQERLLEVFVSRVKDAALFQHTVITCMEVLNYELEGPEQVGM